MEIVRNSDLDSADLHVDAVYQGGRRGNAGDDPLPRLLKVSAGGGFRYRGSLDALDMVVLTSTTKDSDWPDMLDIELGVYTYYGDNKQPGQPLHETPRRGNELLKRIFQLAQSGVEGRSHVPPVFIFANVGVRRDVKFLGLAVPGTTDLRASEDLVAIWKSVGGARFQNYRARFTVLNTGTITRAWLSDIIISGRPHSNNAPKSWEMWIEQGNLQPLCAEKSLEHRTKTEQLPQNLDSKNVIESIHNYFSSNPHGFEQCAGALAKMMLPDIVKLDITRPSRDGGRDAIGQLRIGNGPSAIVVDFALEAKCYGRNHGVSVRDVSRLISRLRHRQFGILVTTSYVNPTAYQEIKEDQHPILIMAAVDIAELLKSQHYGDVASIQEWLKINFPLET